MDDAALAIGGDLAEHAFYLHADLRIFWIADDLGRHLGAFIELDDGKHIRPGEENWSGAVWMIV